MTQTMESVQKGRVISMIHLSCRPLTPSSLATEVNVCLKSCVASRHHDIMFGFQQFIFLVVSNFFFRSYLFSCFFYCSWCNLFCIIVIDDVLCHIWMLPCISSLQVVRELVKYTREFRVVALSATPGSDLKVRKPCAISIRYILLGLDFVPS